MIKHRFRAQALVEFALVIVLLLIIIFGIIEVARLLFVYAAVVTSSREAVRYGSVAGRNDAGDLFYQDCDGIRDTARRMTFFQDLETIDIAYDTGMDTNIIPYCENVAVDPTVTLATGDRIRVTVTTTFNFIVPILQMNDVPIESATVRTIMGIITLE